jgi:hypothetical protein
MGEVQIRLEQAFSSGDFANKGYRFEEAAQAIEFCVELDCQDDRLKSPDDTRYVPEIDPRFWNPEPVYDSRKAVARDLIAYKQGEIGPDSPWAKLYAGILERARNAPPCPWTVEAFAADARYNGFSPYQVAWALYEGRGDFAGAYAIAIRGTVFSARPSALEDFIFQPMRATRFLNPHVSFAGIDTAEVHSGFAHGSFSLLLDDRYGILRVLHDREIHKYARLYLVGHSQGAAMATLVHAFLHHAMLHAEIADVFDLRDRHYRLKSYAFAQPKPGNFDFAVDFASITQRFDNAIVINNALDVVPQVPLTLQDLDDVCSDLKGESWLVHALQHFAGVAADIHSVVGKVVEPFVRKHAAGYGYFFNYAALGALGAETVGHSWNFQPAGHVMHVYGQPGDGRDPFLQHHAWVYRDLIRAQLY